LAVMGAFSQKGCCMEGGCDTYMYWIV